MDDMGRRSKRSGWRQVLLAARSRIRRMLLELGCWLRRFF